jgi:hypothetical protein
MADMTAIKVGQLRQEFEAVPQSSRDDHRSFSIRVWRSLSWLERAESASDPDSTFIFYWIAFNAIYGRLEESGLIASDRAAWQGFLADVVKADQRGRITDLLWADQRDVMSLVDNQYLFRPFWLDKPDADDRLARTRRRILKEFQNGGTVAILQETFERLYVLRSQIFHGAATAESRLNRDAVERGARLLGLIVSLIVKTVIEKGPEYDWGEICFPPC